MLLQPSEKRLGKLDRIRLFRTQHHCRIHARRRGRTRTCDDPPRIRRIDEGHPTPSRLHFEPSYDADEPTDPFHPDSGFPDEFQHAFSLDPVGDISAEFGEWDGGVGEGRKKVLSHEGVMDGSSRWSVGVRAYKR